MVPVVAFNGQIPVASRAVSVRSFETAAWENGMEQENHFLVQIECSSGTREECYGITERND